MKKCPPPIRGWAVRVGGPRPYLWLGYPNQNPLFTKQEANAQAAGDWTAPVAVVIITNREYRQLRALAKKGE